MSVYIYSFITLRVFLRVMPRSPDLYNEFATPQKKDIVAVSIVKHFRYGLKPQVLDPFSTLP